MGRGILLWLIGVPIPVIFFCGCFSAVNSCAASRLAWRPEDYPAFFKSQLNRRIVWSPKRERQAH